MNKIFKDNRRIPKNLQTNDGKEFFNKQFQQLMRINNINHYSTYSVLKASIVERFNRTLKGMMWKEFSHNGSYHCVDIYKILIKRYNNKTHRTIKIAPIKVNTSNEVTLLKTVYSHLKMFKPSNFHVGDHVRISKYKNIFEKGYTPNWTTEIFKIRDIQVTNPITYLLEDYEGHPIQGGFYKEEILRTRYPNVYLVEKVLRTKGDKVLVKWLGFSNLHNSWIRKKDVL